MTLLLTCLAVAAANGSLPYGTVWGLRYSGATTRCAGKQWGLAPVAAAGDVPSPDAAPVPAPDSASTIVADLPTGEAPAAAAGERDLDLKWRGKVHVTAESSPYELVLRFDSPLDDKEIARFSSAAGPLLSDLRWNDTSLVMRPAPGNRIDAESLDQSVHVRFVDEEVAASPVLVAKADSSTELELTRAQADAVAGYPGRARRRLTLLAEAQPDDDQVLRALADAELAAGATAQAARRYEDIDADDRMARRAMAEAGGLATGVITFRHGKTFSQWEGGVSAVVRPQFGLTVGGGIREIGTTAEGVAGDTGYLARIHTEATAADLLANVLIGSDSRLSVQASTIIDEAVTGVIARLFIGPPERQARLFAAYRLPDFSTAEQALFGGYLSRVGVGGTIRITPELMAQADVSWNGYGLAHGGVRTDSILASGGVDYLILRGARSLQLSYRLDAEYVNQVHVRANGVPYIPLSDRENHTVQLIFSMPVATVQLTAAAGWTKDRFGGSGPTASVGAQANLGDAWRIEASGGVSSISRQAISGRQYYLRAAITRFIGR
ncbi:MAG: hypothetical protein ABIQ66_00820 [Novosphingobium sp.]